jgi:hypothetical protein
MRKKIPTSFKIYGTFFPRYLDKVFQPQWERFQVLQPKKYNGYANNHDINQDQVKPGGCSEFCNVL